MPKFVCKVACWHNGRSKMFKPGMILEAEEGETIPTSFAPIIADGVETKTAKKKPASEPLAPAVTAGGEGPNPLPPARA